MSEPVSIWRYIVRHQCELGYFLLTSDGMLAVVSDYGNYAFRWTHFGTDFKRFVTELSEDYLLGKLCPKEYRFDRAATERAIQREICTLRRGRHIAKEHARCEYERVGYLDDGFAVWLEHTSLGEAWEYEQKDFSADARAFYRVLFTRLVALIRAERQAMMAPTTLG